MYFMKWHAAVFLAAAALASVSVRRSGWLDRVVAYHKQNFYNDVQKIAPVQIKAKLEPAPKGYVDSPLWTFDSVMHLLVLISQSETAKPVRRALRRMMNPTRRYIPREKSLKMFPSIMKVPDETMRATWLKAIPGKITKTSVICSAHFKPEDFIGFQAKGKRHYYKNEFYYDVESSVEDYQDQSDGGGVPEDDAVIMVSNPVEARLPSARITVKLLRDILDARAVAARFMVTTPPSTFSWKPMKSTGITAADGAEPDVAGNGSVADAAGNSTANPEAGDSAINTTAESGGVDNSIGGEKESSTEGTAVSADENTGNSSTDDSSTDDSSTDDSSTDDSSTDDSSTDDSSTDDSSTDDSSTDDSSTDGSSTDDPQQSGP